MYIHTYAVDTHDIDVYLLLLHLLDSGGLVTVSRDAPRKVVERPHPQWTLSRVSHLMYGHSVEDSNPRALGGENYGKSPCFMGKSPCFIGKSPRLKGNDHV